MKIVGLTGSIGTGKSTVSKLLSEEDFCIIDADVIAHQQARKGTATFYETLGNFPNVLSESNEIDRGKLGAVIFADPEKRSVLNSITHSWILLEMIAQVLYHFVTFTSVCILDVPLLFEAGLDSYIPFIILVYWYSVNEFNLSDPENQIKRLMSRNKYTKKEALQRISSQIPIVEKRSKSSLEVDNSGSLLETQTQVQSIIKSLLMHKNSLIFYLFGLIPGVFALIMIRLIQWSYYIYITRFRRRDIFKKLKEL